MKKQIDMKDMGYIYLILLESRSFNGVKIGQWYKIGKTKTPKERLAHYNASFPCKVYEYAFLSEKIYNLTNAEEEVLSVIRRNHKYITAEGKREWFKRRKRSYGDKITSNALIYFVNVINAAVDKYYEGE